MIEKGRLSDNTLLCAIIFVYMVAISINCYTHNMSWWYCPLFLGFIIMGMIIPGYALLLFLKKKNIEYEYAITIAYSVCLGFVIVIAEYFVAIIFRGFSFTSLIIAIMVLALSIYYIINSKEETRRIILNSAIQGGAKKNNNYHYIGLLICIGFLAVFFIIQYFIVSLLYTMPNESALGNGYHADYLFWVGNAISAQKGFPIQDFRQVGFEFNYHYFSSIFLAQLSNITGIDIVIICAYFSYIIGTTIYVFGSYCLLSSVLKKKTLVFMGMILLFFLAGKYMAYTTKIMYLQLGYEYASGIAGCLIAASIELLENDKTSKREYILVGILLFAVVGTKGSIGAVLLVLILSVVFLKWTKNKDLINILAGLCYVGIFLFVYLIFISGSYTSSDSMLKLSIFPNSINEGRLLKDIYNELPTRSELFNAFKPVMTVLLYIVRSGYSVAALWFFSIVVFIIKFVKKKHTDMEKYIIFFVTIISGLVATCNFVQKTSKAEYFFFLAVLPYLGVIGLKAIEDCMLAIKKGSLIKSFCTSCVIIIGLLVCMQLPYWGHNIWHYSTVALKIKNESGICWESTGISCTPDQFECYKWISDNTDEGSIIVLDNFGETQKTNVQSYVAGVMSKRFVWNDTYRCFDKNEGERRSHVIDSVCLLGEEEVKLLKSEGIDYYIQNKEYSSDSINSEGKAKVVFENAAFVVYKL